MSDQEPRIDPRVVAAVWVAKLKPMTGLTGMRAIDPPLVEPFVLSDEERLVLYNSKL